MGLNLGPGPRLMVGVMSIGIYGFIAALAWEDVRWLSIVAGALGSYRAWIWRRQLQHALARDEDEDEGGTSR